MSRMAAWWPSESHGKHASRCQEDLEGRNCKWKCKLIKVNVIYICTLKSIQT